MTQFKVRNLQYISASDSRTAQAFESVQDAVNAVAQGASTTPTPAKPRVAQVNAQRTRGGLSVSQSKALVK